jgi:hypothetical protein
MLSPSVTTAEESPAIFIEIVPGLGQFDFGFGKPTSRLRFRRTRWQILVAVQPAPISIVLTSAVRTPNLMITLRMDGQGGEEAGRQPIFPFLNSQTPPPRPNLALAMRSGQYRQCSTRMEKSLYAKAPIGLDLGRCAQDFRLLGSGSVC